MSVNDIVRGLKDFEKLPHFDNNFQVAVARDYLAANHLPLLGIVLSIILWVV